MFGGETRTSVYLVQDVCEAHLKYDKSGSKKNTSTFMAELFIKCKKYLLEFFKFIADFIQNLSAAQQSFKYYNISLCWIFELASTVVRESEIRK